MRNLGWCAMAAIGLSACGGQAAERKTDTSIDTVATAAPAPPPEASNDVNQLPQSNVEAVESGEEYVVHGVCPFECCKYGGNWHLLHGGVLRAEPSRNADSVGSVADGGSVVTDDGAMVLHPPGIAVLVPDTATRSSGPAVGDTVQVISYTGAKLSRVRWHDQEFEMPWSGLRMTREPLQRWWVHMTDPTSGAAGWLQMGGVSAQDVGAPNSCSNK